MIHDEMRELQKYLTPPPIPLFKREIPLIEDKETRKIRSIKNEYNVNTTTKAEGI